MTGARWPVGVVDVVYAPAAPEARARQAAADGFDHLDALLGFDPTPFGIASGCPTAFPKPAPGWCATPAPVRRTDTRAELEMWDTCVRWFRAAPGALLEPWAGAVVHSAETAAAMLAAVPGLRLLVDTGHVADWGGDPLELLEHAAHVQLRQGAPGSTQLHVDDARGVVDFAAVLGRLDDLGYEGVLSVEHFDLPEQGWPLADPRAWALDLAAHVRGLQARR
jgi:sugar phosphate isomerase/epimerase